MTPGPGALETRRICDILNHVPFLEGTDRGESTTCSSYRPECDPKRAGHGGTRHFRFADTGSL